MRNGGVLLCYDRFMAGTLNRNLGMAVDPSKNLGGALQDIPENNADYFLIIFLMPRLFIVLFRSAPART